MVIDRNVLEWRLDPASDARIPQAAYDAWVVLFCNEGYASSLAATSLQDLGIAAATDMVGGYRAWRAAGLSTTGGQPPPLSLFGYGIGRKAVKPLGRPAAGRSVDNRITALH